MSVSFLPRVLLCLLWLGLGAGIADVADAQATPPLTAPVQALSPCPVHAGCLPAPQDRREAADPAKCRHASRRLYVEASSARVAFDAVPEWQRLALAVVADVRTPEPSDIVPGTTRTQRSALRRRQLRALRGRAPPQALPAG